MFVLFRRPRRRRAVVRAVRPTIEGRCLEPRQLMTASSAAVTFPKSQFVLTHPQPQVAKRLKDPAALSNHAPGFSGPVYNHGVVDVNTARGGASAIVAAPDGSRFRVSLSLADNQYDGGLNAETGSTGTNVVPSSVVQPVGTVRVYAMPGGQVGIIVDGSTQYQQLTIDPLPVTQRKGYAHSFGYNEAGRTNMLNIGSIQVNSGQIQAILGFHSANLDGPLSIGGTGIVDRIAFNSLQPGAAIGVGGTLNTLDVANDVNLTAGPGIHIGGDLNLFNVGGNATFTNGASLVVSRFAGLTPQPPKGTATGSNILSVNQALVGTGTSTVVTSVSAFIQGNLIIGPNSVLSIASGIANSSLVTGSQVAPAVFLINGQLNVSNSLQTQVLVPNASIGNTILFTTTTGTPPNQTTTVNFNNLVARNGVIVAGVVVIPHS